MVARLFGVVLGVISVVLFGCATAKATAKKYFNYKYRDYAEIEEYFRNLEKTYPDIVQTFAAQDEFPNILPANLTDTWASCGAEACKTLVVRIGIKKIQPTAAEVYISGALHGDERVGPLIATELAGFLCRRYKAGDEDIRRLVENRVTWITPTTNAQGYYHHGREENGVDPNRDFPYMQEPTKCMKTQAARVVNELFRRHLFQASFSFHGGMRSLTYMWGSPNHVENGLSTESPDDRAFLKVGESLVASTGQRNGKDWYPLERTTDLVYWVKGGMEEWAYAAGFEDAPTISSCVPETFGGYDKKKTRYKKNSINSLLYLVETDDAKEPLEAHLGNSREVWGNSDSDGHVARNVRMSLKLIELAKPEIIIGDIGGLVQGHVLSRGTSLQVRGFGCLSVDLRLVLLPPSGETCSPDHLNGEPSTRSARIASAIKIAEINQLQCKGVDATIWQPVENPMTNLEVKVPDSAAGQHCLFLVAEFDQDWSKQVDPDPNVSSRSHMVRSRVEEHYTARANEGEMRIEEFRSKLYAVAESPIVVKTQEDRPARTSSTASPFELFWSRILLVCLVIQWAGIWHIL